LASQSFAKLVQKKNGLAKRKDAGETADTNRIGISALAANSKELEARAGIEPTYKDLQSSA
jgi:hypothetical protein